MKLWKGGHLNAHVVLTLTRRLKQVSVLRYISVLHPYEPSEDKNLGMSVL